MQQHVQENEVAYDSLHGPLPSQAQPDVSSQQYPENVPWAASFPITGIDGAYTLPDGMYNFDHLMNIDTPQFPGNMDTDIMTMWTNVPSSFQYVYFH